MVEFLMRIYLFLIYPLLMAAIIVAVDKTATTRLRKLEVFIIFAFALSVAGNGVSNFFAHYFLSDIVAKSIGWFTSSPFQLEVAFANLALGILGIIAVMRTDGFREATVIAVTVFSLGATIVHLFDLIQNYNLSPGNTIQNILNLSKPALLIVLLIMRRRAESVGKRPADKKSEDDSIAFLQWKEPLAKSAGITTGVVAMAFGMGYFVGYPVLMTVAGSLLGMVPVLLIVFRSPSHRRTVSKRE